MLETHCILVWLWFRRTFKQTHVFNLYVSDTGLITEPNTNLSGLHPLLRTRHEPERFIIIMGDGDIGQHNLHLDNEEFLDEQ